MHVNSCGVHVNSCGAMEHRNSCNSHAAELRGERRLRVRVLGARLGVLLKRSLLLCSRRHQSCMKRRGQAFLQKQGLGISQEVEIVPGCAVAVACPSCLDSSLVSRGPGRVIRNMLGWSLEEKIEGSGVRLFRRGESIFFPLRSGRLGKEGIVLHSVVGPW